MDINNYGVKFIQYHEGLSLKAYKCGGGFWTIGYGHKMKEGDASDISIHRAKELLLNDIMIIKKPALNMIKVILNENQIDSIISFVYNVGLAAFERSTLRQKINYGDHFAVKTEFLKWIYSKGILLKGLFIRRTNEANLFCGNKIFL